MSLPDDNQSTEAAASVTGDVTNNGVFQVVLEEIGLGDPQMVQQRDNVTGQRLDRHRTVSVGGVPVALQLHRDHLPARRKGFEQRPEIEDDGHQATVEQYEWPTGTVLLVIELQAVHRCVCHAEDDFTRPAD
jgi:hypothetical protein